MCPEKSSNKVSAAQDDSTLWLVYCDLYSPATEVGLVSDIEQNSSIGIGGRLRGQG